MSLKEKMYNMNYSTLNLDIVELAEHLGKPRTYVYRIFSQKGIRTLLEYGEKFGYKMVLVNSKGERIEVTLDDCIEDMIQRRN